MAKLLNAIDALKSYTYNHSAGVDLVWVEKSVGASATDPGIRARVEQKLIDVLAQATTHDAKQFLCRQLRTIGTARAVPQLESLLTDPALSHMARYALGRIDAPAPGQALHRALSRTSGPLKAGVINTLAQIQYGPALPDIMTLVSHTDQDVAGASIRALGDFGGAGAVKTLQQARVSAASAMQLEIDAALLECAERFVADSDREAADEIYAGFYEGQYAEQFRVAGLRGLTVTRPDQAHILLVQAIRGNDKDLCRSAISMMALGQGPKTTDTLVETCPSVAPYAQELIVRALGARGDRSAAPAVIDLSASEHEALRRAALEVLGDIGNARAVTCLARSASSSGGRDQQIARASLIRLRGPGIDQAFVNALDSAPSQSRVELVRALGRRSTHACVPALIKIAQADTDTSVRREAIGSLGRAGRLSELDTLVQLALSPHDPGDRATVERALGMLFTRIKDRDAQARPVITALQSAPSEAKPVLLNLLVRPATTSALRAVRAELKSPHANVSDAAIRALGNWPHAEPAEELHEIASTSSNQTHQVLALRSYIRMAPLTLDPTEAYAKALKLAKRPDEIRLVLGGLHHAGTRAALEMAERYMDDSTLQAEAFMAGIKVAAVYCWQDRERARSALNRIMADAPSASMRKRARDVIARMEKNRDLVVAWQGAGPYQLEDVHDGRRVFDTAFAPEENAQAPNIRWQVVTPQLEGNDRIDLEKTFGRVDYCCAYLRTMIYSPRAQDARLRFEVDDFIKAWLNGREVSEGIHLRQGGNVFMLKVGDHGGGWNFLCRLTGPDGSPLSGLTFEFE